MSWNLPIWNTTVDAYNAALVPVWGAPDVANIDAQIYIPTRGLLDITPSDKWSWVLPIYIRIPIASYAASYNWMRSPLGGVNYYQVRWCHPMNTGFANAYVSCLVELVDVLGNPSWRWTP